MAHIHTKIHPCKLCGAMPHWVSARFSARHIPSILACVNKDCLNPHTQESMADQIGQWNRMMALGELDAATVERCARIAETTKSGKPDPATVEACAKVMDKLAIEQRETNEKYPGHAKAYPSWVDRVYVYERAASTIRSLVSGEPQTRSAHPAGIKPGSSEAIPSGYADYTPVTVRAHTVPNSPAMTTPTLREALKRCDHTLTAHGHIDANTPLHDTIRAALSSPAPDRLSEEERKQIERLKGTDYEGGRLTVCALVAIIDRLSRQPSTEELTANISEQAQRVGATFVPSAEKIETYEAARAARQPEAEPVAWRYKFNGKWHLCDNESFAKQGLEAHPLSPRLDRERLARTLYRRLVLNPPADFDDASADLQNEWLQLADAIIRETW